MRIVSVVYGLRGRLGGEKSLRLCGKRISFLRDKQGLTQEELAKELGITRSAVSHYEKNRRAPDYETLNKLADFFNVTVDFLLGREAD